MHDFLGKWITDEEFYNLKPRNVFHKQLEPIDLPCDEHRNRHILFRKTFNFDNDFKSAKIYITADDYYKLYINGKHVAQGPALSYHFQYNYNCVDVKKYLVKGKNTIAVHTLYQGLINRVWQSGDNRHGLILDLEIDGEIIIGSDESFKVSNHSGYKELAPYAFNTQFVEQYDSRSAEADFYRCEYDDSKWSFAKLHQTDDHTLVMQKTAMLAFESIAPKEIKNAENKIIVDFGSMYVGYLNLTATGNSGDVVIVRCGQELNDDGSVRYELRCNCVYEEPWILRDGKSELNWFDYKAFRYAEILVPKNVQIQHISLTARHYPFTLKAKLKKEYAENPKLKRIWDLCINTQKYGVQEAIFDCMDREKGFYVGDGCYTALTNMLLTEDDSLSRKLIDDAFSSSFITEGLVTCLDCSHMQEIAEFPLILLSFVLWHYNKFKDKEYLKQNYSKMVSVLENYRKAYEHNYLLSHLDKWCVVEWPAGYRDGYDVEIFEGKVCQQAHISINAYYIHAINTVNQAARILDEKEYRDVEPLKQAFIHTFYVDNQMLFRDGAETDHISLVGNIFPFAFDLCPNDACEQKILDMVAERKISSLSLFCTFLAMAKMARMGRCDVLEEALADENAWLTMLKEDATTTFESWSKNSKKNASLFHMTFSYAATFMADIDLEEIFKLQ